MRNSLSPLNEKSSSALREANRRVYSLENDIVTSNLNFESVQRELAAAKQRIVSLQMRSAANSAKTSPIAPQVHNNGRTNFSYKPVEVGSLSGSPTAAPVSVPEQKRPAPHAPPPLVPAGRSQYSSHSRDQIQPQPQPQGQGQQTRGSPPSRLGGKPLSPPRRPSQPQIPKYYL